MNKRHATYNATGLGLTVFACWQFIGGLMLMAAPHPHRHDTIGLQLVIEAMFMLCVGGGSFLNIVRGRFSTWPTIAIAIGYFSTCILSPLGIWGIVELYLERERRNGRSRRNSTPSPAVSSGEQTPPFEYRAAQISWTCAIIGLLAFVLAVVCHVKVVIFITIPVVTFAMLFGFGLGVYALFGIRTHGPRRILIPALIGMIINGSSALLIFAGIIAGMTEGAGESKHHSPSDTINVSQPADTIAPSTNGM